MSTRCSPPTAPGATSTSTSGRTTTTRSSAAALRHRSSERADTWQNRRAKAAAASAAAEKPSGFADANRFLRHPRRAVHRPEADGLYRLVLALGAVPAMDRLGVWLP